MRELKFRIWDGNNGKYFYPDHIIEINSGLEWEQFTGLHDENGAEIYEGDIVKIDGSNWGYGGEYDEENDGYLYVVVPGIDELLADDRLVDSFFDFGVWHHCCEVIGNIHENPELVGEVV